MTHSDRALTGNDSDRGGESVGEGRPLVMTRTGRSLAMTRTGEETDLQVEEPLAEGGEGGDGRGGRDAVDASMVGRPVGRLILPVKPPNPEFLNSKP